MKKYLLLIPLILLSAGAFSQVTNQNHEIRKAGARYWGNGTGSQLRLYNTTITESSGDFLLNGGNFNLTTNNLLGTGSIGATGSRILKIWTADLEVTNLPSVAGVPIFTWGDTITLSNRIDVHTLDLNTYVTQPTPGPSGYVLTSDGSTSPIWAAPLVGSGGGTGDNTLLYTYNVIVGNSGAPADGDTVWTQTNFVENRVEVFRGPGYRQFRNPTGTFPQAENGISFDKATGALYFEPPLSTGEKLIIDVYDSTAVTDVTPPPPGSSSTLLDSLKTYYRLEQNTGTALVDTTGNQNLVTDATSSSVAGKIGRAIQMSSGKEMSGYIYNAATVLNWDTWTVKIWLKLDQLPSAAGRTYTIWASVADAAPYYNALFRMGTDDRLQITVRNSSLSTMASYGGTLSVGIWYQLVVRFRGNGYATQIYVGNANTNTFAETTEVGADIFSGTLYQTNRGMFWGSDDANDTVKWTAATFDELATWGRALTDGEMLESFTKEDAGTGYPW